MQITVYSRITYVQITVFDHLHIGAIILYMRIHLKLCEIFYYEL